MSERVRAGRVAGAVTAFVAVAGMSAAAAVEVGPGAVPPPLPGGRAPLPVAEARAAGGAAQPGDGLVGVFEIEAGSCGSDGSVEGSSFRMIQPGGTASGPFVTNTDSPCDDQTATPLAPGGDGGLSTAAFQPNPDRAFDGSGNGTASAITQPQKFMGVAFAVSTNPTDPQSGADVTKPVVRAAGGALDGDLRAVSVAYNNQHFNQGSPKPDGASPGLTEGPTGTYDPGSGAFTLDWMSTIVGGPFNNFTGSWHLEGTFRPATAASGPATDAGTPAQTPAAAPAASTAGDPRASAAAGSTRAATHPGTGGPLATTTPMALAVVGAAGLLLARRAGRRGATTGPATAGGATTAGGRARRP